jgi:hypothetical protein
MAEHQHMGCHVIPCMAMDHCASATACIACLRCSQCSTRAADMLGTQRQHHDDTNSLRWPVLYFAASFAAVALARGSVLLVALLTDSINCTALGV